MQKKMKKILKILSCLIIVIVSIVLIFEIPSIADFGDFESYDSSSSYDSWDSGSSWSSSDWDSDSSWSSSDWSSSSSSSGSLSIGDLFFLRWLFGTPFGWFLIICFAIFIYKKVQERKRCDETYNKYLNRRSSKLNVQSMMKTRDYEEIKQKVFGYDDSSIEDEIQTEDPLFNKAEFLSWASDMFVRLQYAWSDRNLEEVRYFLTPELFEKTNNQVQRYVVNKQINKLERVCVNVIKLQRFEHQGDRDVLRVILDSKMIDYIIDENNGNVLRGDPSENIMNPYILTFVRKTGVKTPEGGIKAKTMNCPNCGGATTVLSSGKCPYCGSIITTRDNGWTLSELSRYTPNS